MGQRNECSWALEIPGVHLWDLYLRCPTKDDYIPHYAHELVVAASLKAGSHGICALYSSGLRAKLMGLGLPGILGSGRRL